MNIRITYGTNNFSVDVTTIAINSNESDVIYIPSGDINRCSFFKIDPCFGEVKNVYVTVSAILSKFSDTDDIYIAQQTGSMYTQTDVPRDIEARAKYGLSPILSNVFYGYIPDIHNQLLSNVYSIGENSLEISYVLKNIPKYPETPRLTNNGRDVKKNSSCNIISHPNLLTNHTQIDPNSIDKTNLKDVEYIIRGHFKSTSTLDKKVDVIGEIHNNFLSFLSNKDVDIGSLEVWIRTPPVSFSNNSDAGNSNMKIYKKVGGMLVLSSD